MTKQIMVVVTISVDDDVADAITTRDDHRALKGVEEALKDLASSGLGPIESVDYVEQLNAEYAARVVRREYFETIIAEAEEIEAGVQRRSQEGEILYPAEAAWQEIDTIAENSSTTYGDQRTAVFCTDNLEAIEEQTEEAIDYARIAFFAYRADLASRIDFDALEAEEEEDEMLGLYDRDEEVTYEGETYRVVGYDEEDGTYTLEDEHGTRVTDVDDEEIV